ncbi:cation:proton antiporter [Methanosphaera sp. WGK6]|uniref:cation:proton antiporter n=1 Tax=Methanosphaera sp. WGK6 TaxID=1561964 RepID=UPI00084BDC7A|nr:cation:proton antiporter [Methanosphaera sp. WGK6]
MDLYLLENISIILITAVAILLIFNKLKLPSMIGLFLTGIILGQFITSTEIITSMSELGVIFLLFIIGLEFSIEKFSAIKQYAVLGGLMQVVLTTILITIIMYIAHFPLNSSIFMGFLVCFSSTAIVMKLIQKKRLTHSLQGRVTLGILIFQDIAVIIVLLLTPLLGGQSLDMSTLPITLAKLVGLTIIIILGAKWIVPKALHEAARTKNRDLYMLFILFICLGTTYATSLVGISPELGAFIAGLLISNTEYSHQTLGYIQPFQDVFMSIFLISIGLMINVSYFINNILLIIALAVLVLIVKFLATFITGHVLKIPVKTTIAIAILLSQIGEFSFVLATEGMKYGLISEGLFTAFLSMSIITMSATPFLQRITPEIVNLFKKIPYFQIDDELKTIQPTEVLDEELEDHVILVGFGVNGKNLSQACEHYHIPYVIVDVDPLIVEKEKALGLPIIYGSGGSESVLKELKVTSAKCIVIATSDYESTLETVDTARRLNPNIHIIVRTRYLKHVDEVYEAGADEVIPEEFETSIVMFSRVMDYYNKDSEEINDTLESLRADSYNVFRCISPEEIKTSLSERLTDLNIDSIYVTKQKQLNELKFRDYNLTVTSIIRNDKTITGIHPKFELEIDDLVLFTGKPENIEEFLKETFINQEI